jgi:hypothetical protein
MSYGNNSVSISTADKKVNEPHWAILTFEQRYIPGDERSKTHPGHGYPGGTENYCSCRAFLNEADWKAEIETLMKSTYSSKNFQAMYVVPAKITTNISVNVDTSKHR